MPLSGYVPSQIIPKSRIVHLADKQILKRYILSYPKIIVSKNPPGGSGGGGGGVDTWPMDYMSQCPLFVVPSFGSDHVEGQCTRYALHIK